MCGGTAEHLDTAKGLTVNGLQCAPNGSMRALISIPTADMFGYF